MENLVDKATEVWLKYGRTINRVFNFKDGLIEAKPLHSVIETREKEKIERFISYIENKIVELEKME